MYYADPDPYFSPRESSSGVGRGNLMKTTSTYFNFTRALRDYFLSSLDLVLLFKNELLRIYGLYYLVPIASRTV